MRTRRGPRDVYEKQCASRRAERSYKSQFSHFEKPKGFVQRCSIQKRQQLRLFSTYGTLHAVAYVCVCVCVHEGNVIFYSTPKIRFTRIVLSEVRVRYYC